MAARSSRLLPLALASCRQALRPSVSDTFAMGAPGAVVANSSLWALGGARTTKPSKRTTKLILVKDYEQLGNRGEEVKVRPGFARNFLIPQQIAVYSTTENQEQFMVERSAEEERALSEARAKAETRRRLERLRLTIKRHVTGETMYGSVSANDIAKLLQQSKIAVSAGDVKLDRSLKELGAHTVLVHIDGEETEVPFTIVKR